MEIPNRDKEREMILKIISAAEAEISEDEMIESARWMANKRHEIINEGHKANMWICYPAQKDTKLYPGCKFAKCHECKGRISYDPACKHQVKMFAKKICTLCILKNHSHELDPRDRKFLEGGMN